MNVVMIVADSVRTDYLGCHGGHAHTPNLDALSGESVDFTNCFANSFPTIPARGDFLTGRYSFMELGWQALPAQYETIAMALSEAGITTAGIVDTPFFLRRGFNYDRGFQYFLDLPVQSSARPSLIPQPTRTEYDFPVAQTMMHAEQSLESLRSKQPFFLYVDTWDPHEPWDPPEWYVQRYLPGYTGELVSPPYREYAHAGMSENDVDIARACYSGKLTMVDRWIGRLLERLDSLRLTGDTAVLFVSDHGFYFGERGYLGKMVVNPVTLDEPVRFGVRHAAGGRWMRSPLYDEITRIPLMLRVPGQPARTDERLLSAVDIAPTVLDLFGIPARSYMKGRSVLPMLRQQDIPGAETVVTGLPLATPGVDQLAVVDDVYRDIAEWQPITVRTSEWTMLFAAWNEPVELYDILSDPGQKTNVAADHPDVVTALHEELIRVLTYGGADPHEIQVRRDK